MLAEFTQSLEATWQAALPVLRWPLPSGFAWKRLEGPKLDGQQKTMLEIKAPGWQEEDDKLVQKKLNWDLAEWKSNRNSKGFFA